MRRTSRFLSCSSILERATNVKDSFWLSSQHGISTSGPDLVNDGSSSVRPQFSPTGNSSVRPPFSPTGSSSVRPPFSPTGSSSVRRKADYTIYKGKAALSVSPVLPTFREVDSGVSRVYKKGCVILTFWPAIGQRKYDWQKKQAFALSPTEVGSLIGLGPAESCEFFHDPSMKSSLEGQVKKSLSISPMKDKTGFLLNFSVVNNIQKTNERFSLPVTKAEFTAIRTVLSYVLPHIMGWTQAARPQPPSTATHTPKEQIEERPDPSLEWGRSQDRNKSFIRKKLGKQGKICLWPPQGGRLAEEASGGRQRRGNCSILRLTTTSKMCSTRWNKERTEGLVRPWGGQWKQRQQLRFGIPGSRPGRRVQVKPPLFDGPLLLIFVQLVSPVDTLVLAYVESGEVSRRRRRRGSRHGRRQHGRARGLGRGTRFEDGELRPRALPALVKPLEPGELGGGGRRGGGVYRAVGAVALVGAGEPLDELLEGGGVGSDEGGGGSGALLRCRPSVWLLHGGTLRCVKQSAWVGVCMYKERYIRGNQSLLLTWKLGRFFLLHSIEK